MPRLRNLQSGAVVNVSDATAARLGSEWGPVAQSAPKKTPAKKAASPKKSDD